MKMYIRDVAWFWYVKSIMCHNSKERKKEISKKGREEESKKEERYILISIFVLEIYVETKIHTHSVIKEEIHSLLN